MSFRGMLHAIATLMGDVNAVKNGKVGRLVACRAADRATEGAIHRLFKRVTLS